MSSSSFLPTPFLVLSVISIVVCVIEFIVSLWNYGMMAVWLGAGASLATLLYHLIVLAAAFRRFWRHKSSGEGSLKYYTWGRMVWAWVLFTMWVSIFGLLMQVLLGGKVSIQPGDSNGSWNRHIQIALPTIAGFETVFMLLIALVVTRGNKREDAGARMQDDEDKYGYSEKPARFSDLAWGRYSIASPPSPEVSPVLHTGLPPSPEISAIPPAHVRKGSLSDAQALLQVPPYYIP